MARKDIVILGASIAGLSSVHYYFRKLEPKLRSLPDTYHLTVIDSSSRFWWAIAAPRQIVTEETVPFDKTFIPVVDILKQYDSSKWSFKHASATKIDFAANTIFTKSNSDAESVHFDYLIIATGATTPTPLTTLHGSHETSQRALKAVQQRLNDGPTPRVVVSGGGAIGVEIAGELGEALNGKPGWCSAAPRKAQVTIVTSDMRLLPRLPAKQGRLAERYLKDVGVDVVYGSRITRADKTAAGTTLHLDDGSTLDADVYVPATGFKPSSGFVSESHLTARGQIRTDGFMRVTGAPAGVFALGDVSSHGVGQVMPIHTQVPIVGHNLGAALGVVGHEQLHEYKLEFKDTQVVPIGASRGVGALFGWSVPSWFVAWLKGRDYMVSNMGQITDGAVKWGKLPA